MRRSKRRIPHRRKREGKTDYRLRLRLLTSRKPRLVVRKSLNNIICQIVKFEQGGDKVVVSADSKELKKLGWKLGCGNTPAAYLTGLLCAERAKKQKVSEAVLDIGLYVSTQGNRLYSALKGALDGGLSIAHSQDVLPKPERIAGKHISAYAEKLKSSDPSKHRKVFSSYLKNKTDPKDIPDIFEETKKKIAGVREAKEKVRKKKSVSEAKKSKK